MSRRSDGFLRGWLLGPVFSATVLSIDPGIAMAQAVLRGEIRASQSLRPLAVAEVLLENLDRSAFTDDSGRFRLAGIPIGEHQLRVRRIGFVSAIATLRVESRDSLIIDLRLDAWVPELEPIFVKAPHRRSSRMTGFEERRRMGFGTFIDRDELEANSFRKLEHLLSERGLTFRNGLPEGPGTGFAGITCSVKVLVDGIEASGAGIPIEMFRPLSSFEGVEIYQRSVQAPIEFTSTGTACGVILLWTRER